jgi:hypothetical protein
MPPDTAASLAPVPFTQFLMQQRRGLLHAELSDALAEIVGAVVKHGKTGKLTISLTIKSTGDDAIEIADTYAVKAPTPPASPSLFFADEAGQLSRQRLNQPELPLRGVNGGTGATDSDAETGS